VYVEARRRSSLSREVLDSEAKKLFSYFLEYVQSRKGEQVQSFADLLEEFYSEVLGLDGIERRGIRSSLTRRFKKMLRILRVKGSRTSFIPRKVFKVRK